MSSPSSECVVLGEGLEPSRLAAPEPKSGVSANFTTRAENVIWLECRQLVNSETE